MRRTISMSLACLAIAVIWVSESAAESVVYPADAGVFNLRDFGATGDGRTDDTDAFRKAFAATGPNRMLYIPDGVYLISDRLETKKSADDWIVFLAIQGQSTENTIIKLKDNCPGFQDPEKPNWMLRTREGNMAFRYRFSHFTLDTGRGNPGACGISFISCNLGSLMHVSIRSSDDQGLCGIDATGSNPGLSLVKHVKITGFDVGIDFGNIYPGMAFEHIELRDQRRAGFRAGGTNGAAIRGLKSVNDVPALEVDKQAQVILSDSVLQGKGRGSAINNQGQLLVRNTTFEGYPLAIKDESNRREVTDRKIDEYASHAAVSLFPSTGRSLQLPVAETPEVLWDAQDSFAHWVNVKSFNATGDGKTDDTSAIQAALDAAKEQGKSTVYFPQGIYRVSRTLLVSGSVRRLAGMPSTLEPIHKAPTWPGHGWFEGKTEPIILRVADGSPVVIVDRLAIEGVCEHAATNDLVFRYGQGVRYRNVVPGGRAFMEDYGGSVEIKGPQAVFARLWNPTWGNASYPFFKNPDDPAYSVNDGGTWWVMGADHESGKDKHVMLRNVNGARSEIIGLLDWQNKSTSRTFENVDSRLSIAGLRTHTGVFPTDIRQGWRRNQKLGKSLLIVADLPNDPSPPAAVAGLAVAPTGDAWPFNMKLTWNPAAATASGISGYEIRRDGQHIGWSEETQFLDPAMQDDTPHTYEVFALNGAMIRSAAASASGRTPRDSVPLEVKAAYATSEPSRIHVVFSKPVDEASATKVMSYEVEGATIASASLEVDLRTVTLAADGLAAGRKYAMAINGVRDRATTPNVLTRTQISAVAAGAGDGLLASYYVHPELANEPVVQRIVPRVEFDWNDYAPVPEVDAKQFAIRWTGRLRAEYSETYQLNIESAEGVRLWIDGVRIFDTWNEAESFSESYGPEVNWRAARPVQLIAGKLHDVRMELRKCESDARLTLRWQSASQDQQVIPADAFYLPNQTPTETVQKNAAGRFKAIAPGTGLTGIYHRHAHSNKGNWERHDARIDFDFGEQPPAGMEGKLQGIWYRIEWHGWLRAKETGWHTFGLDLGPKDHGNINVDGYRVLQAKTWWGKDRQVREGDRIFLRAGELVPLHVFYRQEDGSARISLWWKLPNGNREIISSESLYSTLPR